MAISHQCSVCGQAFTPQFSYQMEERVVREDPEAPPRADFLFFCSQRCLEASHRSGIEGTVTCDACAASFRVELASQVLFIDGHRRYACGADCRTAVLAEARGVRLGDTLTGPDAPAVAPPLAEVTQGGRDLPGTPELSPASAEERPTAPAATGGQVIPLPAPGARTPQGAAEGPRVLAIFNHKGGTGKTTTSVTLAAGLAARGQRVLLVDTDGQGNVAVSLNLPTERSLYHVLVMGLAVEAAVTTARPGLDVLPSNETLAAAELYLAGRRNRDRVLANRLAAARDAYDTVIVDCSPSLSLMNQNALCFADAVLCPVACDYLSLVGVRQVLRTIKQVNRVLGHPVRLWGVLPTLYDSRARVCHEALDTLREHFKDRCLEPIRAAIRVKEAPAQGRTLFEHAPDSSAAEDYLAVVERLLAARGASGATPAPVQHRLGGTR